MVHSLQGVGHTQQLSTHAYAHSSRYPAGKCMLQESMTRVYLKSCLCKSCITLGPSFFCRVIFCSSPSPPLLQKQIFFLTSQSADTRESISCSLDCPLLRQCWQLGHRKQNPGLRSTGSGKGVNCKFGNQINNQQEMLTIDNFYEILLGDLHEYLERLHKELGFLIEYGNSEHQIQVSDLFF